MSDLFRAVVTKVTSAGIWVKSPLISGDISMGPIQMAPWVLKVNDNVLIGRVGQFQEDVVVVAPLVSSTLNSTPIYYFDTQANRNAIIPTPPVPTFTWSDDVQILEVYTHGAWQRISWNETRVAAIETRTTNLEGLAVLDTVSVDLTLSPGTWPKTLSAAVLEILAVTNTATINLSLSPGTGWPKTLSASVVADSIPLNNLSDVVISSPATNQRLKYNGTNWVNAAPVAAGNGIDLTSDTYSVKADPAANNKLTVGAAGVYVTPIVGLFAKKTGNQSLANSTSLNDITDLAIAVEANATYWVFTNLVYDAGSVGDLKIGWSGPTGATFDWNVGGAELSTLNDTYWGYNTISGTDSVGANNVGNKLVAKPGGVLTISSTAGTFKCRFAQNVSEGTSVTIYAGSSMLLLRVA